MIFVFIHISLLNTFHTNQDGHSCVLSQGICRNATERSVKKFKRQKVGTDQNGIESGNVINAEMASQIKHDIQCIPLKDANLEARLVNWMSMDETQFLPVYKLKDEDSAAECDDTDDSIEGEDYEEVDTKIDRKDTVTDGSANEQEEHFQEDGVHEATKIPCLGSSFGGQSEQTYPFLNQVRNEDRKNDCMPLATQLVYKDVDVQKHDRKETKNIGSHKTPANDSLSKEASLAGVSGMPLLRNPPKVAFCPKEVKRILDLEAFSLKNAESHTIRKIIVFASLGIRHGFDDMYELDFNHFSILRKGEPYVSPKDPGVSNHFFILLHFSSSCHKAKISARNTSILRVLTISELVFLSSFKFVFIVINGLYSSNVQHILYFFSIIEEIQFLQIRTDS